MLQLTNLSCDIRRTECLKIRHSMVTLRSKLRRCAGFRPQALQVCVVLDCSF